MSETRLRSVDYQLLQKLRVRLGPEENVVREEVHLIGTDGLVITRSSLVSSHHGRTILSGLVDTVQFHLTSTFILTQPQQSTRQCLATMDMTLTSPFRFDTHKWEYEITPSSVTQTVPEPQPFPVTPGLDVACVIRCGGKSILKCLLGCLPTLAADPTGTGYSICVLGCAGLLWTTVVDCIVDHCI
jgi:hypothetical protein